MEAAMNAARLHWFVGPSRFDRVECDVDGYQEAWKRKPGRKNRLVPDPKRKNSQFQNKDTKKETDTRQMWMSDTTSRE